MEKFPIKSLESRKILDNQLRKNISKIEDEYLLYTKINDSLIVILVTHQIQAQKQFISTSLYLLLFFTIMAYFFSLWFVKTSLKSLNLLVKHAQDLHFDFLDKKIHISGPDDDEIKILANAMNDSLQKIHNQTNALKDFVSNASHELKTPLMVISSEIDLALKSKDYSSSLKKIKIHLKYVDNLLEQLLMITKLETENKLSKKKENISELTKNIAKMVFDFYENKGIIFEKNVQKNVFKKVNTSSIEIIVKNLLDNAFKYTKKWGKVSLILTDKLLIIQDTGIGIEKKNFDKIWERFWKVDVSRTEKNSFGLGLYLVKKLIKLHNWEIWVKSFGEGTEMRIIFDRQ